MRDPNQPQDNFCCPQSEVKAMEEIQDVRKRNNKHVQLIDKIYNRAVRAVLRLDRLTDMTPVSKDVPNQPQEHRDSRRILQKKKLQGLNQKLERKFGELKELQKLPVKEVQEQVWHKTQELQDLQDELAEVQERLWWKTQELEELEDELVSRQMSRRVSATFSRSGYMGDLQYGMFLNTSWICGQFYAGGKRSTLFTISCRTNARISHRFTQSISENKELQKLPDQVAKKLSRTSPWPMWIKVVGRLLMQLAPVQLAALRTKFRRLVLLYPSLLQPGLLCPEYPPELSDDSTSFTTAGLMSTESEHDLYTTPSDRLGPFSKRFTAHGKYFQCICGAKYQRREFFSRHVDLCQKVATQDGYTCSCSASYVPKMKVWFQQHVLECGRDKLRQPLSFNGAHHDAVSQSVSDNLAMSARDLSPSSKEPIISETQMASPAASNDDSYCGGSCNMVTDLAGDSGKHQQLQLPDDTLKTLRTTERNTKTWIDELKITDVSRNGDQCTTKSFEDDLYQASSRDGINPEEEQSIVTDSDLFSISDTSDPQMCLEIGPLSPIQENLLDHLLRDYRGMTRCHTGGCNPTTPAPNGSSLSTRRTSRSTSDTTKSSERDSTLGSGSGPSSRTTVRSREDDVRSTVLACPFWKHDRERHRRCCTLTLRRIRDVKQHLHRRHTPETYCDRCLEIFEDADRYEIHVQSTVACFRTPDSRLQGITRTQSRAISKKSGRNLGEEEQWFAIWDTLFPDTLRPASAYVDLELSEDLNSFQEYWTNRGHDVLMDELNRTDVWSLSPDEREAQARQILAAGLNTIYERWAGLRDNAVSTTPHLATTICVPSTSTSARMQSSSAQDFESPMSNINQAPLATLRSPNQAIVRSAATENDQAQETGMPRNCVEPSHEALPTTASEIWLSGAPSESYVSLEGGHMDFDQTTLNGMLVPDTAMDIDFELV